MSEQQRPTPIALQGFDPRSLFENAPGLRPGEGNLIVGGETTQVLGRMTACFLQVRYAEGEKYIQGVSVIAPPRSVWDYSDDDIRAMVVKGLEDIAGEPCPEEVIPRISALVRVLRCNSLDANEAASAVAECGERQVILIPLSSKYRDPNLLLSGVRGRTVSRLAEDIWVPHAVSLGIACTKLAEPKGSVIVFDANEEPIVRKESFDALCAPELLFPLVLKTDATERLAGLLSTQIPRWVALSASGKAQQAYSEVDAANLDASIKRQVLLQVAARAGEKSKVLSIVHEYLAELDTLSAETLARLGRLSNTHGDKDAALRFFDAAIDNLDELMWLEASLLTITSLGAHHLFERCWSRLDALFPTSVILRENRELRLLKLCETQVPAQAPVSRVGFEDVHNLVANELLPGMQVDYDALVSQVKRRWPQHTALASLCASLHALENRDLQAAVAYGVEAAKVEQHEALAVRILLGALKRMFLLEMGDDFVVAPLRLALVVVLQFLGRNPDEASLRAEVASTLSIESAGAIGLPLLVTLALDVLAQGATTKEPPEAIEPASEQQFMVFFKLAMHWMSQQPAIEAGAMRLPPEIVGNDAKRYIASLTDVLRHAARHHEKTEDLVFLEQVAFMLCLLHPYAPEYSADLEGLRLLAAKVFLHGQPQRARDYAEQMLALSSDSDQRRRIAWGNYADIYQRARSPADALIGLTCAALTRAPLAPSDLFQEAYTLLRVARELHLFELARSALRACRRLYDVQCLGEQGEERLQGIELTLDVAQHGTLSAVQLLELLERTRLHCEQVMQGVDELHPPAAHFLQIAGAVERAGGQLPPQCTALREELNRRLGPDVASLLRTISAPVPEAKDLVWLYNRLGTARNSEDAPTDYYTVVLAAARLLQQQEPDIATGDAIVAIELLSERGVELTGAPIPLETEWPTQFVRDLSQAGLSVLLLAVDSDDELVVVVAEAGDLRVIRPARKERSFKVRLDAWASEYPYRYGSIERDEGNGEFYKSMAEFELPMPRTKKVLVVMQPLLQQIPFNLALVDGEFAGEEQAIGMAPSLTWLNDARKRLPNASRARHAWISCSQQEDAYGSLDMIYARLEPVFEQHGFAVDTSGRMPVSVRGAGIAVVTAHGQLTQEKRYIHSIADEGTLTESVVTLARTLADVELVILFVCSGGRVDPHPMANTSVSLPKLLIDRGCRTVIASPWPLAVTVPGNWLESFLQSWDAGETAIEANLKANAYVRERLGPEPGLGLAMTVYGDVLLTR